MGVHDVSQRWDVKWFSGKVLIAMLLLVTVSAENITLQSNHTKGVDTNHHAQLFYDHTWPVREFTNTLIATFVKKYVVIKSCQVQTITIVKTLFRAVHVD